MKNLILSEGIQDWIGKGGNESDLKRFTVMGMFIKKNSQTIFLSAKAVVSSLSM